MRTVGGVKKTPACAAGVAARGIPGESENKPGTHNWPRSTERWSQRRRGGGWCRRGGDRCMFGFNLGHFGKEPIYGDRSLASEKTRSDIERSPSSARAGRRSQDLVKEESSCTCRAEENRKGRLAAMEQAAARNTGPSSRGYQSGQEEGGAPGTNG